MSNSHTFKQFTDFYFRADCWFFVVIKKLGGKREKAAYGSLIPLDSAIPHLMQSSTRCLWKLNTNESTSALKAPSPSFTCPVFFLWVIQRISKALLPHSFWELNSTLALFYPQVPSLLIPPNPPLKLLEEHTTCSQTWISITTPFTLHSNLMGGEHSIHYFLN